MGYFDDMANEAFKKDASGNAVYYPWGPFGYGLAINSEETRERIWNSHNKGLMIILVVFIPLIIAIGLVLQICFGDPAWRGFMDMLLMSFPFYCVWQHFAVKKLTRDLPITT